MEHQNKEAFRYTYSAKEQEEIKAIRSKYDSTERSEDKMARLRRLDAGVTEKATAVSLVLGILGALILGLGMCFCMVWGKIAVGTVIGLAGIVLLLSLIPLVKALK